MKAIKRTNVLVGLAVVALGLSCGGGGGGGNQQGDSGRIDGVVYLGGPVSGATVTVTQRLPDATPGASFMTTTASDGTFSVDVGIYNYAFEITSTGGTETDIATGATVAQPDAELATMVLDFGLDEKRSVVVSPFTTLAHAFATARRAQGKDSSFFDAHKNAIADVSKHFLGIDDVTRGHLVGVLETPQTTPVGDVKHVLAIGTLSRLAHDIAQDSSLSVQQVNAATVLDAWIRDVTSSPDALFDGYGEGGAAIIVGACAHEASLCQVNENHLRAVFSSAAAAFLTDPANKTGLRWSDLATAITNTSADTNARLFPPGTPPGFDLDGPTITWVAPAESATISGTFTVDVRATDLTAVQSLTVTLGTNTPLPADEDPAPDHFLASNVDSKSLPEGGQAFTATATDVFGEHSTSTQSVVFDNAPPGQIGGTVALGRWNGATVNVYKLTFPATPNPLYGTTTTNSDGTYSLQLGSGYSGDLLVEVVGPGTYPEEARPGTQDVVVQTDANDRLRTVVPGYVDGATGSSAVVVTPATEWATSLALYLRTRPDYAGRPFADAWADAVGAIQGATSVPNIVSLAPALPTQIASYTAAAKYTLLLIGISQQSLARSTTGGGDAGAFGAAMASKTFVARTSLDIADGCLDGKVSAATDISFGGTQKVTGQSLRRDLADGIAAYLKSGANVTPFTSAQDVLPTLDALSQAGLASGVGSCPSGSMFELDGSPFDQQPPDIMWIGMTPQPANAVVRGTISVQATATDNISSAVLSWVLPMNFHDDDNDMTNANAQGTIDTTLGPDGTLTIKARAVDKSGVEGFSQRDYAVDNTPPLIVVDGPPSGVEPGKAYTTPRVLTFSMTDAHPGMMSAMLTSASSVPVVSGAIVPSTDGVETAYRLYITGTDGAGNSATPADVSFSIDRKAPVIAYGGISPGAFYSNDKVITFDHTDLNHGTTAATLNGTTFVSGASTSTAAGTDKVYALHIVATDVPGNSATADVTFVVDRAPPTVTITGVTDNAWYNANVTPVVSVTDTNLQSSSVTLDGNAFVSGTTVSAEGPHMLVATGTDKAGTTITKSVTFSIDKTKPAIAWGATTPTDGASLKTGFHVEATATDNLGLNTFALTAPAGQTDSDLTLARVDYLLSPAVLGDQTLTVAVTATDRALNAQTATRTFILDTMPPVLDVTPTGLLLGSVYWSDHTAGLNLTGTAMDAHLQLVTVTNTTNGTVCGTSSSASWSVPLTCLVEGANTISVAAADTAGSITTKTVSLGLDTTAPDITISPSGVSNEASDSVVTLVSGAPVAPVHTHSTSDKPAIDRSDCTNPVDLSLYGYLHDADPVPAGFGSDPVRNPFTWSFTSTDTGAGIDSAANPTQYRVSLKGGAVLTDWRDLTGAGSGPINYSATLVRRNAGGTITAPAIPALATTDATFQIDFRTSDRFGHVRTETRCWKHHPLAAPVSVETAASAATDGPAGSDKVRLGSFSLTSASPSIPQYLLNDNATGVGIVEFKITNFTAEDVYVTLSLTPPTAANRPQYTVHSKQAWAEYDKNTTVYSCFDKTGNCFPRSSLAKSNPKNVSTPTTFDPSYTVRLFETTAGTFPTSMPQTPCSGCTSTGTTMQYKIAARSSAIAKREYTVVPSMRTIPELRPGSTPGYSTTSITYYVPPTGTTLQPAALVTGKTFLTTVACDDLVTITHQSSGDPDTYECHRLGKYWEYLALQDVSVTFPGSKRYTTTVATTPSVTSPLPAQTISTNGDANDWSTAQPVLPP